MMRERQSDTHIFLLLSVIYRLLLDYIFGNVVIRFYSYEGYTNAQNTGWIILSWCLLVLFALLYYRYYDNAGVISREVLFLLYVISIVPFTTMISFGQFPMEYVFLNTSYWVVLYLWQSILSISKGKKIKFVAGDMNLQDEKILYTLAWLSFLVVIFISGRYMGFRFHFGLSTVYEIRRDIDNLNLPTVVYYLFSWTKAINPICLAYFILHKKKAYAGLAVFVQLLSFGINGMKATLFTTLVVIAICVIPEVSIKKLNRLALVGMISVCALGILLYKVSGSYRMLALIVRRIVFTPNRISWCYYDYFQGKVPDFFRGSILQHFGVISPYPNITRTIGAVYYGSSDYVSNNGLISDGIVNFGNLGAFIMPFFVAVVLKIFDNCSEKLDKRLYISCSIPIVVTLTSMFLSTALLTNGFILIMILLYVMKRSNETGELS